MSAKNASQIGVPKRSRTHQYRCGLRQPVHSGINQKIEPLIVIDRTSVTLEAIKVRFAEIEAKFNPTIQHLPA
jgi:hypothetical protein